MAHSFDAARPELGRVPAYDIDMRNFNGDNYDSDRFIIQKNKIYRKLTWRYMDKQKRGKAVQGEDSLESTDQGTPCSLQEEAETDKSEKIILSEDVGTDVTAVQLMRTESESKECSAEVETVRATELSAENPTSEKLNDDNYFASLHTEDDFETPAEVIVPVMEDRQQKINEQAARVEDTCGDAQADVDENDRVEYPEVHIHSLVYENHHSEGLEAVRAKGIPRKKVEYIAVHEWSRAIDEDQLIFTSGRVEDAEMFMQVDDGSQISCIHLEQVQALGLESKMVKRSEKEKRRVRGIGTKPGEGEVIRRDVWMKIRMEGSEVVDWQCDEMAPIEGKPTSMVIEGWFAVLSKMGVPMLLGGDILHQYDVITRTPFNSVVLRDKRDGAHRVSLRSFSMQRMMDKVRQMPGDLYTTPVWKDMAKSVNCATVVGKKFYVNRARVPPGKMKTVKVRYNGVGHVPDTSIFGVKVIESNLRVSQKVDQRMKVVYAFGWDPERDDPCFGHPTVKVINLTDEWLEVEPEDILVEVCQYQVTTRYVEMVQDRRKPADKLSQVYVNHVQVEQPVERPELFPEWLWGLVHKEEQTQVKARFDLYPKERLKQCIEDILYELDVHADRRPMERPPWENCENDEDESTRCDSEEHADEQESRTDGVINQTDGRTKVERAHPSNLDARVSDYFQDTGRIRAEMERRRQCEAESRPIRETDLLEEPEAIRIGEGVDTEEVLEAEMKVADLGNLSSEARMDLLHERMQQEEKAAAKRAKAREEGAVQKKRKDRMDNMFVEGKPTEMAYLIAQALARITSFFHPDPDNPPRVKGFVAEIETSDDVPIRAKARKFADVQKAYLRAMSRKLLTQGKWEVSTGEYASGLVLVPYHDRIKKFMDQWGDQAATEMWKEEHQAEVSTFYRCTCDYRRLNVKSKSDVFPLPRIDDLLDQIPVGSKHFSSGDVQDAFWTVKLAEWCREKTAIRTHEGHYQWTVLPQGWKGAANYWARVVADVFGRLSQADALVYQDDVLAHSKTFSHHYHTLRDIYQCLEERRLTFKLKKTHLNMPCTAFLGHMIDESGRYPSPEKVKAIMEKGYPKEDVTAVRSFIGMTLYYRNYIYDYANKVAPLNELTRKGVCIPEVWSERHEQAVDQLKEDLSAWPCLMNVDNSKPFQIRVDACRRGHGLGGVLLQQDEEDQWRPVSWWSRALTPAEKEYSATELECKALHDIILYFDVYLQGVQFDVFTDHCALIYMVKAQEMSNNGRLMRYLMDIQHYNFRLYYKKGTLHVDADAVSRLLKLGEQPQYLDKDSLEWDKGPITDEEMMISKDLAEKKRRRIERAELRKKLKRLDREGKVGVDGALDGQDDERKSGATEEDIQEVFNDVLCNSGRSEEISHRARYQLRNRITKLDQSVRAVPGVDNFKGRQRPAAIEDLEYKKRCGYNRLRVVESTIPKAGYGLFLGDLTLRKGNLICTYEGEKLTAEQAAQSSSAYIFEAKDAKSGKILYIDAEKETSCFGRYANDPRNDHLVNAKIVLKGGRLVMIATTEIGPGDEIFVDYGVDYWSDKLQYLKADEAAYVREVMAKRGVNIPMPVVRTTELSREDVQAMQPKERKAHISRAQKQLTEAAREKYSYDNVEQCPDLAEELQYLVGKDYFDDETGVHYQVDSVEYDPDHRVVVGYRRAMDGKLHKDDDAAYAIYGDGGILSLVELWGIDGEDSEQRWPTSEEEWAQEQQGDPSVRHIIDQCGSDGAEVTVDRDTVALMGEARVLYRKFESKGREIWQKWVPEQLRELCMKIHHEGSAHPGSGRMLETTKLRFYWPAMRHEIAAHCSGCIGCALRSAYLRRPVVPVQQYPEVGQPLGRIHIDLTGELPTTDGNKSKYIMVVKDFHTKFVWLFALKTKDALAVADQLVTELYCRWGIPEMVVHDRGTEFRNKLQKRISHIFKVNKISTTPYSPRSNGFVEKHNSTLKEQLYHYVEARQKDWDIYLPTVQLMYNTTVNSVTNYTPYYLMFGRECNMPNMGGLMTRRGDRVSRSEGEVVVGRLEQTVYEAWEEGLLEALERAWAFTSERACHNASRGNRTGRSGGRAFREYEPGDQCYRKRNRLRSFKSVQDKERYKINVKLQSRYEGPYTVTKKINAVVYEVNVDGELKRIHAINMKPGVKADKAPKNSAPQDMAESGE